MINLTPQELKQRYKDNERLEKQYQESLKCKKHTTEKHLNQYI